MKIQVSIGRYLIRKHCTDILNINIGITFKFKNKHQRIRYKDKTNPEQPSNVHK